MPFSNSKFDVRFFDDLIRDRGEWVTYYEGARCPCGSDPSQADFSCPNCRGLGHFYPNPPQNLCALITDIKMHRDLMAIPGFVLPGDLVLSMRPYRGTVPLLYDFDKIVLTFAEGIPLDGETIIASPTGTDHLLNQIVAIKAVYGINPLSTTSTEAIVTYRQNTDFIASGTTIQWVSTNRPQPGHPYTVRYTGQPNWLVFSPPNLHYERNTSLGQTAILRKQVVVMGRA